MEARFYIMGEISHNFHSVIVITGHENNYEKSQVFSGEKSACEYFIKTGDYKHLF